MALKPGGAIWVPPSAAAIIARDTEGSERVADVILDSPSVRRKVDPRLDGSIQGGTIESATTGAPMLTLDVLDPDNELLNSALFDRRIDTVLDGIPFRLVEVDQQESEMLSLQFEHRLVSWLREHEVPRKASRNTKTRAEFAYSLVLEVKKGPVTFISPDLHKKQKREKAESLDRETKDERRGQGFPANATGLTIKGSKATRSQLKNVDTALSVAAGLNASPLATKAMVVAGIGESSFVVQMNQGGSPYGGVFQGKVKERGGPWDIGDTEGMANSFLKGGKGFQGGGAIALAKRRPPLAAGAIAYMVEGDISNFGYNAAAATAFYQKHSGEADKLIDAWRGEALSSSSAQGYYKKFEFTRGKVNPGDAPEDSWVALQRLASDVRWRCFISGKRVVYFVSDEQLMRSRPLYLVTPETQGVKSLTFNMEVGKRTVIVKGRRQRKPSEATLSVRLGRWAAPPGSVIELAGYGLADGRWLVDSMSRPIFDADGTVELRQPQKALPEPAPETATRSTTSGRANGGGGGSATPATGGGAAAVDKVYAKAIEIHRRNLPYGAGGHGQIWGLADQAASMDCSSSTSMALHAGGMMNEVRGPVVSDWFLGWGEAGEGDLMTVYVHPGAGANGHVWIHFTGRNGKRFDTSPYGSGGRGPHVRYTERPTSGFTARHWKNT